MTAKSSASDVDMPVSDTHSMLEQIQNFVLEVDSDGDERFVPGEDSQFEDSQVAHEDSQAWEDSQACEGSQFARARSSEGEEKNEAPTNSTSSQAPLQDQTQPSCSMCAASAGDIAKDPKQNADTIPWAHYDVDRLGDVVPVGTSCFPCERARKSDFVAYGQDDFELLLSTNSVVREFFVARRKYFADIGSARRRRAAEAADKVRNNRLKRSDSAACVE